MSHTSVVQSNSRFILVSAGIITLLILLINTSFKIIIWQGLVFTVTSFVSPLMAGIYLIALRGCSVKEQRHLLNCSLVSVYLFCIGVFILVNLPASEYLNNNRVYQIIFEALPKKFFATTLAFALSFYAPHMLFCKGTNNYLSSPQRSLLLSIFGGLSFFCINFYFLFAGPHLHSFQQIFIDSFMINLLVSFIMAVFFLAFSLGTNNNTKPLTISPVFVPVYHYLLCLAVIVMLLCLACEYRIISFGKGNMLTASCIFYPVIMIISTVIFELWDFKAHLKLIVVLVGSQLLFDSFLMGIVTLPSPHFFNLNQYYSYVIPRRLSASTLSLLVTFLGNSTLLFFLQRWGVPRALRIILANIFASSILCFVDYSLLFGGIYSYEQVVNLAIHVWRYKLITTLIFFPVIWWLCSLLEKDRSLGLKNSPQPKFFI